MCYPKPGPRCSSYALKMLAKAQSRYDADPTLENYQALAEAYADYYLTPKGLEELRAQLELAGGKDPHLITKLEYFTQRREALLAELKASQRNGREDAFDGCEDAHDMEMVRVPLESLGFSREALDEAVQANLVNERRHPSVPEYVVYDYSDVATYTRAWNEVTVACRGLIIDPEDDTIVARPFGKFFNDSELAPGFNDFPRVGPVVVTDKADGSMGILYRRKNGEWRLSTRGSLGSEQANHASALYNEKYASTFTPPEHLTFLYEIIYPQNRVVLDYNGMDDLVLLGAVDKRTGRSLTIEEAASYGWTGPVVEQLPFSSYEEVINARVPDDREGFVVHFLDNDKRVKIKGERYLSLHRVVTNVTPLRVWEQASNGVSLDEWLVGVPEEFTDEVRVNHAQLMSRYEEEYRKVARAGQAAQQAWDGSDRKNLVMAAQQVAEETGVAFAQILNYLDSRDDRLARFIWQKLRPSGAERF